MQVEIIPTRGAALEDLAASIAKPKKAITSPEQQTIGGEKAVKLTETFADGTGPPVSIPRDSRQLGLFVSWDHGQRHGHVQDTRDVLK